MVGPPRADEENLVEDGAGVLLAIKQPLIAHGRKRRNVNLNAFYNWPFELDQLRAPEPSQFISLLFQLSYWYIIHYSTFVKGKVLIYSFVCSATSTLVTLLHTLSKWIWIEAKWGSICGHRVGREWRRSFRADTQTHATKSSQPLRQCHYQPVSFLIVPTFWCYASFQNIRPLITKWKGKRCTV